MLVTIAQLFELNSILEVTASLLMKPAENYKSLNHWIGQASYQAEVFGPILGVSSGEIDADWRALDEALYTNPADPAIVRLHPNMQRHITKMREGFKKVVEQVSTQCGEVEI